MKLFLLIESNVQLRLKVESTLPLFTNCELLSKIDKLTLK